MKVLLITGGIIVLILLFVVMSNLKGPADDNDYDGQQWTTMPVELRDLNNPSENRARARTAIENLNKKHARAMETGSSSLGVEEVGSQTSTTARAGGHGVDTQVQPTSTPTPSGRIRPTTE